MRIESFFDSRNNETVTYSYTRRHTDMPYYPDFECERENLSVYDKSNGWLFHGKEVSWRGEVLLNDSIDINVTLPARKYVDHISLCQGEGSAIGSIDVFANEKGYLKKIGVFEKDSRISDTFIEIPVGYFCDNVIVRLNGCFEKIAISKFDIIGASGIENTIYPVPENIEEKSGELSFSKVKTITAMCDEAAAAVNYLSEKLADRLAITVDSGDNGQIVFEYAERNDDGYDIEVDDSKCVIKAGNMRGFIYAADTFLQLATETGFGACRIEDKPFMDIRGVHIALPSKKNLPFLKKLVKDVWVPMKYNMVFLQLAGAMRYDAYPEINDTWLLTCEKYEKGEWPIPPHYAFMSHDIYEKDEVRELCDYIRSFGLEIAPEIQSFGHTQYITTAHREMAEVECDKEDAGSIYAADAKPESFYAHNMCPSHENYYKVFFTLIDEVVDTIQPERFIHMGHDEIYVHGQCEKCAVKGSSKVFSEEVTKLNDYIKSKGLNMAIWSDMLQKEFYSIPEAINDVPKDVLMFDFTWYFHPEQDLEDRLLSHGFNVVMGNMYSSHYPRYNYRSTKPGMVGAEVSTWVLMTEHSYAYEGKMYDFVYSANMMWNKDYDDSCRCTYNEIVKNIVWDVRKKVAEIDTTGDVKSLDFAGDIKNVPAELLWNNPYEKAVAVTDGKCVEVKVNDKADVVLFTQATDLNERRAPWTPATQIGEYEFVYTDGSTATEAIDYGVNIMEYNRKYALPYESGLYRHEGYVGTYMAKPVCGKDSKGRDYTLYDYPVKNPCPEKIVDKVVVRHLNNTDAKILIFDVKSVKN